MIRVKTLEKKDNKFLIERYYKEEQISEFIVCENYDFDSNTYQNGIRSTKLVDAYLDYNKLINDYDYYCNIVTYLEKREKKKIDYKDKEKDNKVEKKESTDVE